MKKLPFPMTTMLCDGMNCKIKHSCVMLPHIKLVEYEAASLLQECVLGASSLVSTSLKRGSRDQWCR